MWCAVRVLGGSETFSVIPYRDIANKDFVLAYVGRQCGVLPHFRSPLMFLMPICTHDIEPYHIQFADQLQMCTYYSTCNDCNH